MPDFKLTAEPRTEFGKGAARRIRRDHKVPAVLYGHGTDPVHLTLPGHETMMVLKHSNALITVTLGDEETMALAKDVQRDPVRDTIEHVDLLLVRKGEKVEVEVPVRPIGESAPGTNHFVEQLALLVEAEATNLPQQIDVPIDGLPAGTVVHAGDIVLPEGVALVTDPGADVINVTEIQAEPVEGEAAEEEGVVEAATADEE